MVDVTGRIGSEQVELNNAATEATLRMLLQATLSANKQNHDDIAKMAKQAGLDPASVAAANENLNRVAATGKKTEGAFYTLGLGTGVVVEGFKKLDTALSPLISQLLAGTDKVSDVFGTLEKFAGPLSGVVNMFGRLARFQEEGLESYQKMTKAGVNFGGSLTDMRTAAASTYMTLTQFSDLMKNNSASFAKMGGSVDAGARAFVGISNTLNKGEMGTGLRALGYTTQEVNQGMIDYISISGGRNRQEMQDTKQLAKESTNYLEQLDGLSKLTGESKEALAAKMKDDAAAQAFEGYLLTLDKDGREKAIAARLEAEARGGKGAAQALQAKLMGLPPMTEAAQKFVGTMKGGNNALDGLANNVKDSSKSLDDVKKSGAGLSAGLAQDGRNLKQVASAQIMAGKDVELFGKALKASNDATRNGVKNTQEQIAFEAKIAEETKKQKASEASAAVETQKAVQELGQTVLAALLPAIKLLTPIMNTVVGVFGAIVKVMNEYKTVTIALAAAAAAYLVIQKTQQILSTVNAAKAAGGKGLTGGLGVLGALAGGKVGGPLGSSPANPMWVKIVGGGGGGIEDLLDGGKKGKPTAKPAGGKGVPANRAARLAEVAKGRAAQAAAAGGASKAASAMKGLKGAGVVGALAGIVSAGSDIIDINAKLKAGEISKEEASKQKGGVVGETAGGAAGGWAGAAGGAALGTLLLPGIGTVIGGLLGGALGAFGGGAAGKAVGEKVAGPTEKDLPKFEKGGIATKSTAGIFGEAGTEALIPLTEFSKVLGTANNATKKDFPPMSDDAMKYMATMSSANNATSKDSPMDRIKDMLSSLPMVGAAKQAGGAVSSAFGNISGSKTTELLSKEIETLNKNTIEMLKQLKEIADHTRQGVSATKSLSGNLFKF